MLGLAVAVGPAPLSASEQASDFAAAGLLIAVSDRADEATNLGAGAELSITHYPSVPLVGFGVGSFLQIYGTDRSVRCAAGTQLNYAMFGIELGSTIELPTATEVTNLGVQIAPFVSLGVLALSLRAHVSVHAFRGGARLPSELGTVLTMKYPFPLGEAAPIPL